MVALYLDTADVSEMQQVKCDGITTNPSWMKKSGISNYRDFAQSALEASKGKPISFEVLADNIEEMHEQAIEIASWGNNVFVKVPVTNSHGDSTHLLVNALSRSGIQVNVTAVLTIPQIRTFARELYPKTPSIISIFAGRIADTGVDPVPFFTAGIHCKQQSTKLLWASTREVYNIKQARDCGADIITLSYDLLRKYETLNGRSLEAYSLDTVKQFLKDAEGVEF